jgi:hypothetical protein
MTVSAVEAGAAIGLAPGALRSPLSRGVNAQINASSNPISGLSAGGIARP